MIILIPVVYFIMTLVHLTWYGVHILGTALQNCLTVRCEISLSYYFLISALKYQLHTSLDLFRRVLSGNSYFSKVICQQMALIPDKIVKNSQNKLSQKYFLFQIPVISNEMFTFRHLECLMLKLCFTSMLYAKTYFPE